MDTTTLTNLEAEKAYDRFIKHTDRTVKNQGYGATVGALGIVERFLAELSACVLMKTSAASVSAKDPVSRQFVSLIRDLAPQKVALCALQGALHSIGDQKNLRDTMLHVAELVAAECWGAGLTKDNPRLAEKIARYVKGAHGNVKHRRQAARSLAAREGFQQKRWPRDLRVHAGAWLVNLLLEQMPHVFDLVGEGEDTALGITEGADDIAQEAIVGAVRASPVFLPSVGQRPAPWNGWASKDRFGATVLRSRHKDRISAVKHAIATGQMQPALDALNTLQGVAWAVNSRVLDVMQRCVDQGIPVPGLPTRDIPTPGRRDDWDELDEGQKRLHRWRVSEIKKTNRALASDRLSLAEDMETARLMVDAGRFWTPMNMDWRGRVYALTHFNFQREDRVRALFNFADGEPIGEEGIRWLKIHLANCGDFDKISKRPFSERIAWVDENLASLRYLSEAPTWNACARSGISWIRADKPFLFLAACFELTRALAEGASYVSSLPVSWDGSCSGLQHLAAMTRDEQTAALVNLRPADLPSDVYGVVAERACERIKGDEEHAEIAKLALAFGIGRKEAKRNVMTYAYSSKVFGMSSQQQVDLMDPLAREVLEGKRDEHPFETYAQGSAERPSPAARFLAKHTFAAIEETVHRPATAMHFLQKGAKAMAHEGKPLRWTTPTGIPWINRYHASKVEQLSLWLFDKGVKVRYKPRIAVGEEHEIDKDRAANGVAPNFVHALDAAHLALTAVASAREGIAQIATVHDSFGCLASRAKRFNEIIREQFVEMYSAHDVLAEVLAQAQCDLTPANTHRLEVVPDYGSLELQEVLNATFAFS